MDKSRGDLPAGTTTIKAKAKPVRRKTSAAKAPKSLKKTTPYHPYLRRSERRKRRR